MFLLPEILVSIIRIFILLLGILLTFIFGNAIYQDVNNFLYANNTPCIGLISFLVAFVSPIALFYGIYIRKYFWQRPAKYNWILFFVSYAIGIVLSFLPLSVADSLNSIGIFCPEQMDFFSKVQHAVSTGIITSILAYIGLDIGVSLKHVSSKIQKHNKTIKKKKQKRARA